MIKVHANTEGRTPEEITEERGASYGHPMEQFSCVEEMMSAWVGNRNNNTPEAMCLERLEMERCLRHAVYMILTKLSRACADPLLMDTWADIKGYAKCFEMCVERSQNETIS